MSVGVQFTNMAEAKQSAAAPAGVLAGNAENAEWKTGDHEKYGDGKRVNGKHGTKFSRVEKAGQRSMERETDKYRCTVYN